jgi:hypothetical protein
MVGVQGSWCLAGRVHVGTSFRECDILWVLVTHCVPAAPTCGAPVAELYHVAVPKVPLGPVVAPGVQQQHDGHVHRLRDDVDVGGERGQPAAHLEQQAVEGDREAQRARVHGPGGRAERRRAPGVRAQLRRQQEAGCRASEPGPHKELLGGVRRLLAGPGRPGR